MAQHITSQWTQFSTAGASGQHGPNFQIPLPASTPTISSPTNPSSQHKTGGSTPN